MSQCSATSQRRCVNQLILRQVFTFKECVLRNNRIETCVYDCDDDECGKACNSNTEAKNLGYGQDIKSGKCYYNLNTKTHFCSALSL